MVASPGHPTALPLSYRRSGRESNPRPMGPVNRSSPARRCCYSVEAGGRGCDHRKLDPACNRRAEGRISPLPSWEITDSLRPTCWKSVRRYTAPGHFIFRTQHAQVRREPPALAALNIGQIAVITLARMFAARPHVTSGPRCRPAIRSATLRSVPRGRSPAGYLVRSSLARCMRYLCRSR